MIEAMQSYFQAEKSECLLFMTLGLIACAAGIFFLLRGSAFQKGMACPLIAIALIQVIVGGAVYFRTDKQVADLIALYKSSPAEYRAQELPRMEKVNRGFDQYKMIEISLIATGLLLIFYFRSRNPFWFGIGTGLALQSAIMLTLDFVAEARADVYTRAILNI